MAVFVTAVAIALVVSFLCSIFEASLLSIGLAEVERLDRAGKRSGRILKGFKRHIDAPIAAILIANTIAHTIGASVAGASYSRVFRADTLWIFTIVFTIAVLLFTEIIPKTTGVIHAARLAGPVAYGVLFLTVLLRPFVKVSELISRSIRRGQRPPVTSVEEIRLLAALGRREGEVDNRTAGMILGATHLRELRTRHVLVPRAQVVYLSATRSREENLESIRTSRHSRFPFTPTGVLDDATGIVLAKEIHFRLLDDPDGAIPWEDIVREPMIVPDTKPLNDLLRTFQRSRNHQAFVVNEHGGFDGIVTLEDVLEEIVGEIMDESDLPNEDFREEDGSIVADARAKTRKVFEHFGLEWPRDRRVTSVGGLLARELERVPERGDAIECRGLRFEVLSATLHRAEEIRVARADAEVA